jgi:hypothetical protein
MSWVPKSIAGGAQAGVGPSRRPSPSELIPGVEPQSPLVPLNVSEPTPYLMVERSLGTGDLRRPAQRRLKPPEPGPAGR